MDRETMTKALLAAGWGQDEIDQIKDDAVLGVLVAHEMKEASGQAPEAPAESPPADAKNADMPPPEQMIADLVAMGMKQEDLQAMTPEDLAQLWQQKKGTQMAEPLKPAAVQTPAAPSTPNIPGMPGTQPTQVTLKFAEELRAQKADLDRQKAEFAALKREQEAERKLLAQRLAEEKKATVTAFCERMVKAGKVLPAELHPTNKDGKQRVTLIDRLLRADAVRKFSDGPLAGKTELEAQMAEIEARPELVSFHERMKQPAAVNADDEVQKVKRFSESAPIQDILRKKGETPADYVRRFQKAREKNPNLTARDYGVSPEYAA